MRSSNKRSAFSRFDWYTTIQLLVCIALLVPLVFYIWGGTFMRYSGDDYCYGSTLGDLGFWDAQVYSYLNPMPFNGNRFSLTLFSNIGDLFGPLSGAIMPGLAIIFGLAGLCLSLREIGRFLRVELNALIVLLASAFLVFVSLYQAPSLLQDLYWRSTMLAYLAPVIALTWLSYLLILHINSDRNGTIRLVSIAILALIAAGFSETGAAFQTAVLIAAFTGLNLLPKCVDKGKSRLIIAFGLAGFMTILSLILLAFSPSNADRIGNYPHPAPFQLITLSLTYGLTFILESLKSYPLPSLVTLVFSAGLAMEISSGIPVNRFNNKQLILAGLILCVVTFLLVCTTAAPSVLARSAFPEQRAWMPGRIALVCGLASIGFLVGLLIDQITASRRSRNQFAFLVIILATGVYAIRAVPRIVEIVRPLSSWSSAWDMRDDQIRADAATGIKDVHVKELPMIIPYVSELKSDPGYWYNICAADWYGLNTITADVQP